MPSSDTQFKPGNTMGGRKKGARHKYSEQFIIDLHEAWKQNKETVIANVLADKPDVFMRVLASLVPKDVNLNLTDAENITDDEARKRIAEISEQLAGLGVIIGASDAEAGDKPRRAN